MAQFYQLTSLNSEETFFLNLETIVKIEEHGDSFVRLYLVSGDIEDVDMRELNSAMAASGTGFYRFEEKAKVGFDALDDSDVEDVTDLSDGHMVRDEELAEPNMNNAQIEGAEVVDEDEDKEISVEEVAYVIQKLRENGFNLR